MFELNPRLSADTVELGRLPLSLVLLSRDANYPWVLLVPCRDNVSELHQLDVADRAQLVEESCDVARAMQTALKADRMNVASLGNLVPQLHVHHIARYRHDLAWPGAVWGAHPPGAYTPESLARRQTELSTAFATLSGFVSRP